MANLRIRNSSPTDLKAIESLYPEAFPDEDLVPLVRRLLPDEAVTNSLVGEIDGQLVAHVIFTDCAVTGSMTSVALLGPLVVAVARHGQGIGTALVQAGLAEMKKLGTDVVCVLGDPAYYGRLSFVPEPSIRPPYPLPAAYEGAWQSQRLSASAADCEGGLLVPPQWREPSLWLDDPDQALD